MCFDRWKMLKEHLSASQVYSFVRSPCPHALKAEKQWLISTCIEYVQKKKITLSDCNMKILLGNSKRFCQFFFTSDSWYTYLYYSAAPFSTPLPNSSSPHTAQHCVSFVQMTQRNFPIFGKYYNTKYKLLLAVFEANIFAKLI